MGRKISTVKQELDLDKKYSLKDAISLIKKHSFAKFDETLDIAINLGVDPKHSDQMVRGVASLPSGTGREVKVAVICKDERIEEAKKAGADLFGSDEIISDIKSGKVNFDVFIATPDMMGLVGQVARILGPKGLMPNPKVGTVSNNITDAVQKVKCGQVEYRVEKAGIVHAGLGRLSFSVNDLLNNVQAFLESVIKSKPDVAKGSYLKKIHLSSTMGPSLSIDLSDIKN